MYQWKHHEKGYLVVEVSETLVEKITVKNSKTSLEQGISLRFFLKKLSSYISKENSWKRLFNILCDNRFFEWLAETFMFFKRFESEEVEKIDSSFHGLLHEYLSDWCQTKVFAFNIRQARFPTGDIHVWEHNFFCNTNGQHRNIYSKT